MRLIQRQHPERTRHMFQDAEVAAALRRLKHHSPHYLKQREGVCRDEVAEAALGALAALRCASCRHRSWRPCGSLGWRPPPPSVQSRK